MRKKFLLQSNDLNNSQKETIVNTSSKVTVQYIRGQQLVQKLLHNINHPQTMHDDAHGQDELEIENVEYLEEHTNVDEFVEPNDKDELEDNFYPNAIHCLLDLYKIKYESFNIDEVSSVKVAQIWHDIAKDMQESFFEFDEKQIQHKYILLREQYFGIKTKEEIENFDYFEQLHNIYKDPSKENIVKGIKGIQVNRQYYKDEILLQPEQLEVNEDHSHDFKSDEIVHKEHEFIDMVEKELQAMEDGTHIEDNKEITTIATVEDKKDSEENINSKDCCGVTKDKEKLDSAVKLERRNTKRTREDTESEEGPQPRKQKTNNGNTEEPLVLGTLAPNDFTLYHYNEQQERRHREKMYMFEKSLQIQERALEQQHLLLQELMKRLPS